MEMIFEIALLFLLGLLNLLVATLLTLLIIYAISRAHTNPPAPIRASPRQFAPIRRGARRRLEY